MTPPVSYFDSSEANFDSTPLHRGDRSRHTPLNPSSVKQRLFPPNQAMDRSLSSVQPVADYQVPVVAPHLKRISLLPPRQSRTRIILVPRSAIHAYVYWEIAETDRHRLWVQGGQQMMLRVHDVTDVDTEFCTPYSTQTYRCRETDQDKRVVVPVSDRDYVAELGYLTSERSWLSLIRSAAVRVPAVRVSVSA